MSRCLIIINPVSGGGAARRYALDLQWKLSTLFETIEVKFTRGEGDATRFAKNACERGFDAVFCMGGDGTVNETVNGIAQGGFSCTFGFIPVGTVNDMSRALGIPQNPTQAIRRIDINETRTIDIGRCNDRYFCNNIATLEEIKVISEEEGRKAGLIIELDSQIDDDYIAEIKKQTLKTDIPGKENFKIVY
ncbi:MAG: diacylglycerol kinase family protein, partial [Veillonella parvula]